MLVYRYVEAAASNAMLDKIHPQLSQSAGDDNIAYTNTLGEISGHNIVLTPNLPTIGGLCFCCNCSRSHAYHISFHSLWLDGRNWRRSSKIHLGDVVVSKPTGALGGVVQYDYGKTIASGVFQQTGAINQPPQMLLNAIARLQANDILDHDQGIVNVISNVLKYECADEGFVFKTCPKTQ